MGGAEGGEKGRGQERGGGRTRGHGGFGPEARFRPFCGVCRSWDWSIETVVRPACHIIQDVFLDPVSLLNPSDDVVMIAALPSKHQVVSFGETGNGLLEPTHDDAQGCPLLG